MAVSAARRSIQQTAARWGWWPRERRIGQSAVEESSPRRIHTGG